MKQLIFLFIIILTGNLFGQTGELRSAKKDNNYTWRNSTSAERDSFYFGLPVVKNSRYQTHFRISLTGQTIDFFSNDNENFQGILTNKITQYKAVKTEWGPSSKEFQYVFQQIILDSALSSSVAREIIESGQDTIPTDSLLPTWKKSFFDCPQMVFQIKDGEEYKEQIFSCPGGQTDTTGYIEIILSNYNLLLGKLELEKRYDDFESLLPKGKTYSINGSVMIFILTDKQIELWKKDKPRRDYLSELKDSIDIFLIKNLKHLQASSDSAQYPCYDTYHLTFGRNGKLKKIWTNQYYKIKIWDGLFWYIEDRLERRQCKRKIQEIFKEVNLENFDLEHEVDRSFSFRSAEGWVIRDNTLY